MIEYDTADAWFTTPRGTPVLFRYRVGTNDWNTLWACLNEDEYGLASEYPAVAVDIGGYLGGVAIGIAVDNPKARVLVVEPVPDNIDLIRWAIEANKLTDRIVVIPGAVGDGSAVDVAYRYRGTEAVEHHAFVGNSTLAYDNPGGFLSHDTVTYTSLTVADIVGRVGEPDLVKIDTEGGEWSFLAQDVDLLPLVLGEWHPVRGHGIGDLLALLEPTHVVSFTGPQAGPGGFRAVRRVTS